MCGKSRQEVAWHSAGVIPISSRHANEGGVRMVGTDGALVGVQAVKKRANTIIGELLVGDLRKSGKVASACAATLRRQVGHLVPTKDGTGGAQVVDGGEACAQLAEFGRCVEGVVRHKGLLGRNRSRGAERRRSLTRVGRSVTRVRLGRT